MPRPRLIVYCIDPARRDGAALRALLLAADSDLEVVLFDDGAEALAAQQARPADIVFADLAAAPAGGVELIVAMQAKAPPAASLLTAARIDLAAALDAVNRAHVLRLFEKPVDAALLAAALVEARAAHEGRARRRLAELSMAALDRARVAVATLDADLRVVYASEEGGQTIRASGGFALGPRDELRGADAEATARLLAFLDAARNAPGGAGVLRVDRGPGRLPVIVSALYAPGGDAQPDAYNLVLTDPERKPSPTPDAIAAALGVTPSEARIVHGLALGMDVGEAAKNAGVSLSTARTYLRNSFSKTGVTRQAELVRLALLTAA